MLAVIAGFGFGAQELLIILVIVMILFGSSKVPQLARSLGSSVKEFKEGIKEGAEGEKESSDTKEESKNE